MPDRSAATKRGKDRTPWLRELMHGELCATRFGMYAKCDCAARKDNG